MPFDMETPNSELPEEPRALVEAVRETPEKSSGQDMQESHHLNEKF